MVEKNEVISVGEESQVLYLELQTPEDTEIDLPVYITGNFNEWKIPDPRQKMWKVGPGRYKFEFYLLEEYPEIIEYKYTRGNWESVELKEDGQESENRLIYKSQDSNSVKKDYVPLWKKTKLPYNPNHYPIIEVISESFEIPQLIKTRRIAALLPHNYYQSEKHYPVLYLQDGQNLFDDYAPFGSWGVDKKLAEMSENGLGEIIIISIDHAKEERIEEFTPSYKTKLGRGQGKKYVRFLADTLKPYVDKNFRTLNKREFTGIGGSSMGALISIYAGFMYPEVFSKLMVFSPSLWVAPNIHFPKHSFR